MTNEFSGTFSDIRVFDGRTNERLDGLAIALNECTRAIMGAAQSGANNDALVDLVINKHADALASLNVINTMKHVIGTSFGIGHDDASNAFNLLIKVRRKQG